MMKIVDRMLDSLTPLQVCWACMALTLAMATWAYKVFAKDVEVQTLRKRVDISARLSLAQEIRAFQRSLCAPSTDRVSVEIYLERLQAEYEEITGNRYPDMRCN